jgi:hypothetical protein
MPRTCGLKTVADLQAIDKMFDYFGPSWASRSFDPPGSPETNLAKEWGFSFNDCSWPGATFFHGIELAKRQLSTRPIVWIQHETLCNIFEITGIPGLEFIQRPDWKTLKQECDYYCLNELNKLNRPVLLIGAHSDIPGCSYSNITIGHSSWQTWLALQAGLPITEQGIFVNTDGCGNNYVEFSWGAEVIHRIIHQNPNVDPDPSLLDAVIDIYLFWKELEKHNLFYEVHPSYKGNVLFAKELKPVIINFLGNNK